MTLGVDSSLYFDNDLLKSGLTDALLESMEAAPVHMGQFIDRRSHGDHMGDTNSVWVFGDEGYWDEWKDDKGASDKLGLYKSPYTVKDYYKQVTERKSRLRREQTGMLETWIRGIGTNYPVHQEAELFSIVFGKVDLQGTTTTLTGIDEKQLFSETHTWSPTTASFATDPGVPAAISNDLELPATLSDGVTVGTAWSQLAVEDAFVAAMRAGAGFVTDKNRPFNLEALHDVTAMATSLDTVAAPQRQFIEAAFDSNYQLSNDVDKPYKGRVTPIFTPFIPTARRDRIYFAFSRKGLDGNIRQRGSGGLVLVDHMSPEKVEVDSISGKLTVDASAAHAYAIGQWWLWICVRLNGTAASDA